MSADYKNKGKKNKKHHWNLTRQRGRNRLEHKQCMENIKDSQLHFVKRQLNFPLK